MENQGSTGAFGSHRRLLYRSCYYNSYGRYVCNGGGVAVGGIAGIVIGAIVLAIAVLLTLYVCCLMQRRRRAMAQYQTQYAPQYPAQPTYANAGPHPTGQYPQPPPGYPAGGGFNGGMAQGYPANYPPTFGAHVKQDFRSLSQKFGSGRKDPGTKPTDGAAGNTTTAGAPAATGTNSTQPGLQMSPLQDTTTGVPHHQAAGPVV